MKLKGLKKCKTSLGLCDVSEAAKSCVNCRYNKCLSIGMTPDLLQGKRKREEQEPTEVEPTEEEEELEEKVFSEPTGEENEEPDPEAETEVKHLIFTEDIAEQPEQDQPLKLVKRTNTQNLAEPGKMLNLVIKWNILLSPSGGPDAPSSHSSCQRTSVIRYGSGSAAAAYDEENLAEAFLRCESEMLRHQSSILMQAGM